MTQDQLALLADARISSDARLLVMLVMLMGEGWHEVEHATFRALLTGGPSNETVRRHLRAAEAAGWIERKAGGRGHATSYRFLPRGERSWQFRDALVCALPDKALRGVALSEFSPTTQSAYAPPVVRSTMVGSSTMEKSRAPAREDPGVSDQAAEAMAGRDGDLNGCRGALRDYLETSVPTSRQYGYVQTLVTWLDGIDRSVFQLPDGGQLPADKRTGYLALALNELMAGDESQMKRPVGDPGNLKTKLNILLKQRSYDGGSKRRNGGTGTGPARGEATGIGRNQGGFRVERGEGPDAG